MWCFTRPPALRIRHWCFRLPLRSMHHTPNPPSAIILDCSVFMFFLPYLQEFCSSTIWNMMLESLWKDKSNNSFKIKIGRLPPEKFRNMFERIQIMKKSYVCSGALYSVQYVLCNPHTLLPTSRGLAGKVRKLVLILKLTQEPKNAMRLRKVVKG